MKTQESTTVGDEPRIYSRSEHPVSRKNIDRDALKIMYRLIRHGYKGYLVGGGVRDLLLGKVPKDFDIATDATPRQIRSLFRNSRIIGRRFKLIHVYFRNNKIIEVSTFRDENESTDEQSEQDTNDPDSLLITQDNVYGTEQTDARRRDITINGLFYNLDDFSVIDYVGGFEDLQSRLIRVIGDPDVRFAEDPVRLLRTVRHAARADFEIEALSLNSLKANSELIFQSAQVRIYVEFAKDLCSGCFLPIVKLLHSTGMLQHLMPELDSVAPDILSEDAPLSQFLWRVDEFVRKGNELTVTPVLSLLFLAIQSPTASAGEFKDRFGSEDELLELLARSFPSLAVPRKERERLDAVLTQWLRLEQSDISRIKAARLARKSCLPELALLIDFLYDDDESELSYLLEEALKIRQEERSRNRRRGRGSNRRRRRRGNRGGNDTRRRS